MTLKQDTSLTLKLPGKTRDRIDSYRARLPGIPSRSEVVRRLIDEGLSRIEADALANLDNLD